MKTFNISQIIFWTCLVTSICLSVAGFIIPPTGVIDGSVITVIGLMLGFATLGQLPTLLSKDKFSITHGNTHLVVGDTDAHCDLPSVDLNEQLVP